MKHLFVLGFLFLGINIFAQGLTITDGIKDKTFKKGSIFLVHLTSEEIPIDGKITNWSEATGEIFQISQDSFSMILTSYESNRIIDHVDVKEIITSVSGKNYGVFPTSDLLSFKHYKSYKSKKRKKNWNVIGGLLMFTGMVTSMNAFLVPKDSERGKVLISGGIQVGLGIGIAIASSSKKYNFKCGDDPLWEIKH